MKKPGSKPAPKVNRKFKLEPYSSDWPRRYENKAALLQKILAPEIMVMEHVGSTAIPGMWAKPQIDILIVVKDLGKIKSYYKSLESAGFTPRGDYTGEGEEYFSEDTTEGTRITSIHIMPMGHAWAEELVYFRDYLRTHPEDRNYYSHMKRQIAIEHKDNYTEYFLLKRQVVHEIRDRAEQWKDRKRSKN